MSVCRSEGLRLSPSNPQGSIAQLHEANGYPTGTDYQLQCAQIDRGSITVDSPWGERAVTIQIRGHQVPTSVSPLPPVQSIAAKIDTDARQLAAFVSSVGPIDAAKKIRSDASVAPPLAVALLGAVSPKFGLAFREVCGGAISAIPSGRCNRCDFKNGESMEFGALACRID